MRGTQAWRGYRFDRLDMAAVVFLTVLLGITLGIATLRSGAADFFAPSLDLALDTIAGAVMVAVSLLSWVRYSERREPIALFQAAAFQALAIAYVVGLVFSIATPPAADDALAKGGEAELYLTSAGRLIAAATLVIGGVASLRGVRPRHPYVILAIPTIAILAAVVVVQVAGDRLPELVVPGDGQSGAATATPFGVSIQMIGAVLTMTAGELCRRLWRRDHVVADAYLALGLIVASFAQIHEAAFPGVEPIRVASSDILWLFFGLMLVLAIEAEARRSLDELRRANETLERLRNAEADRAALEERTKLSRELHDGLAQDLWLAKLKAARLVALPDLSPEASVLSYELDGAIEAGLAEARNAVETLRMTSRTSSSFRELLVRSIEEFEDRFGIRTELECPTELPHLGARTESELLRIAQEGLSNVARHADATLVSIRVEHRDGNVRMSIRDNGVGFDPDAIGEGHYGVAGMRERAGLARGEMTITSHPQDGTLIEVLVPVAADPDSAQPA